MEAEVKGNKLKAKGTWGFLENWTKYLFMCLVNKLVIPKVIPSPQKTHCFAS